MPTFELAEMLVAPGERGKGHIGHVTLADGTRVGVPVVILNGVEDGPTLVVTASVHGTEIVGTGSLIEVVRHTDPKNLRGRLVAITAANPFAFQVGSYFTPFITPTDGLNLAGAPFWPANPSGRLTERVAAIIASALQDATHFIDLHSNPEMAMPFTIVNSGLCRDEATREQMGLMAEAFGITIIDDNDPKSAILTSRAVAQGLPAMCPELTADMLLREDNVQVGAIGLSNVMKALGMVEGPLELQPKPRLEGDFVYHGRLTANTGGLMWVRRQTGTFIPEGEVVVEIMSVWGDIVEEIRMPVDGYCWSFTGGVGSTHAVAEGTSLAYVFRERSVQPRSGTTDTVARPLASEDAG
jgi:predicted deacylase